MTNKIEERRKVKTTNFEEYRRLRLRQRSMVEICQEIMDLQRKGTCAEHKILKTSISQALTAGVCASTTTF